MLNNTTVHNEEMISYDDYVFDIITGTWISALEYESFLKIDNDELMLEHLNVIDDEQL